MCEHPRLINDLCPLLRILLWSFLQREVGQRERDHAPHCNRAGTGDWVSDEDAYPSRIELYGLFGLATEGARRRVGAVPSSWLTLTEIAVPEESSATPMR